MPTIALARGSERFELTWYGLEGEVWRGSAERILAERSSFADFHALARWARAELRDRRRGGFGPAPAPLVAAREAAPESAPADREEVVGAWLRAVGHPYGAFLARRAEPGLWERVHAAVLSDFPPDRVGARWAGGFLVHLRVHLIEHELPALVDLLRQPAAWFLEALAVHTGPIRRLVQTEHGPVERVIGVGRPLQPAVDALAALGLPPTLAEIELRGPDGPLELAALAATAPGVRALRLEGLDAGPRAATAFPGLERVHVVARARFSADVAPSAPVRWLEPSDLDPRSLVAWPAAAPLVGRVGRDGVEGDPPPVDSAMDDSLPDEDFDDVSGASGSGGEPDDWRYEDEPAGVPLWDVEIADERGGLSPDAAFAWIRPWEPPDPPDSDEEPSDSSSG